MRRLKIIVITSWCACLAGFCFAAPEWKKVGETSDTVTSLEYTSKGLLVGTRGNGLKILENAELQQVNGNTEHAVDEFTIHSIKSFFNGETVFVGTDGGVYRFNNEEWESVPGLPQKFATCILFRESTADPLLFIVSLSAVYRGQVDSESLKDAIAWDTLRAAMTLPSFQRDPSFMCGVIDNDTVYIGSVGSESNSSWRGLLRTPDVGDTWEIWNENWTNDIPPGIQSFVVINSNSGGGEKAFYSIGNYLPDDYPRKLFEKAGEDGMWEEIEDLSEKGANTLYFDGTRIFCAADSGVFTLGDDSWIELGELPSDVSAQCLASNEEGDSLFAGTTDGLYIFSDHASVADGNLGTDLFNRSRPYRLLPAGIEIVSPFTSLSVYDLRGTVLFSREGKSRPWRMEFSELSPVLKSGGTYLFVVDSGRKRHIFSFRLPLFF